MDHIGDNRPTIAQVFDDYVPAGGAYGSPRPIDLDEVIVKKAGYGGGASSLDLLPSRLELSRTLKNPTGKERRLAKALARISDRYDLILIDCAPTESILTDAAYFASRYVIVPVKPEFMATIGLPLLARSLQEFQIENDDHEIEIAGLVFQPLVFLLARTRGTTINHRSQECREGTWLACIPESDKILRILSEGRASRGSFGENESRS